MSKPYDILITRDYTDSNGEIRTSYYRCGVAFENTGKEPLVTLRYFGPGAQPGAPKNGAWRK